MSLQRVKPKVPKVRPYDELPQTHRSWDHLLLWGTFLGLFVITLVGGGWMWLKGRDSSRLPALGVSASVKPLDLLTSARSAYVAGEMKRVRVQAEMALALELASPSEPGLESELRRLLSLAAIQEANWSMAQGHLQWLWSHQPTQEDLHNLQFCQAQLNRVGCEKAWEQLRRAEAQGLTVKALNEARQAARSLEAHGAEASSLRLAHLRVVDMALRQKQRNIALLELQIASQYGPLSSRYEAMLHKVDRVAASPQPTRQSGSETTSVQTRAPLLGEGPSYPLGQRVTQARPRGAGPEEEVSPRVPGEVADVGGGPTTKVTAPKLELPKLQIPDSAVQGALPSYQGASKTNSLPSYQAQGGNDLPTYHTKTRVQDRLPGY